MIYFLIWSIEAQYSINIIVTLPLLFSVRLLQSIRPDNGVVNIFVTSEQSWFDICLSGFGLFESRLVCKELGYNNGTVLPQGSFGKYNKYPLTQISCKGTEDSIFKCNFLTKKVCSNKYFGYAAVSCFNGSSDTGKQYNECR